MAFYPAYQQSYHICGQVAVVDVIYHQGRSVVTHAYAVDHLQFVPVIRGDFAALYAKLMLYKLYEIVRAFMVAGRRAADMDDRAWLTH